MFQNDRKTASVILRGLQPPDKAPATADTSGDTDGDFKEGEGAEGLHAAAEEMISAIHSKDAKGFHRAMQNYMAQGNASDYDPKTGQNG